MSAIALRPFLPADSRRCAAIFRDAIDVLASEDYGEEQRAAWAAPADDALRFGARLADALTLVAVIDGAVVGFASLKNQDCLDMLYVDPAFARRGVGATLIDAIVRIAVARGAARLTSDVSDGARSVFERQQFVAERRNLARVGEEWLATTTMTRQLAAAPASDATPTRH